MQAQSVTLDFLKPVGTVVDLSDKFNARVGDSMTPFNLFVTEGGKPKALNGLHPELEATVGDGELKDGKVVMSDSANGIHWVGNAKNVTGYNRLTLTFPAEVFPQSGFCYGHLILANDAGVRESSVDIWFKVLDGLAIMGLAADYYDSAIELELKKLKEANSQAAQRLSEMKATPEGFANLDDLKAKYPIGNSNLNVTVDDGHLWIWLNGGWRDCGQYQAAGVDDAIATRITAATEQTKHGFDKELDQEATDRIAGDQQLRSDLDGLATIKNAVELKDIDLLDDDGNPLTDQDGQHVTVQNYLPKTDMIGNQKGLPIDSSLVGDTFLSNLTKYGLPVLYLDDDRVFGLQTKKDKLSDVPYHWVNAPGDLKGEGLIKKLKVQGNSSSTFPKKSYKFTLDNPGTAKVGWVSSDEYAVKAYWADFSHLRDIGVSHLWAQMRRDRITAENSVLISDDGALSDQSGNALAVETDPSLTAGTTFGTIDGFPIFLVIDGKYNGFYDLIIPKSPEMAKMPDRHSTTHRAIISAEPGDICGFQQEPALNDDGTLDDGNGWSIEFVQDEDDQKWVGDAVKKLYDVISADYANADDFTAAVSPYVDLDSAIDLWLLVIATQSNDEVTHNFLMQTYDGKKWYFAPYDNDITFGLNDWHGTKVQKANTSNAWIGSRQKLWGQLTKHCADKIKARWDALRSPQGTLSELNVWYVINTLAMALPVGVYEAESKRWPAIPGTAAKDASQIITYYDLWIKKQDEFIAKY